MRKQLEGKKAPVQLGGAAGAKARVAGGDVLCANSSTVWTVCQVLAQAGRRLAIRVVYAAEQVLYRFWRSSNDLLLAMLPTPGGGHE